jgi:hypothetical protein
MIQILKDQVKDLQNQNGFLINEFQRLNKINEQLLLTESQNQKKLQNKKNGGNCGKYDCFLLSMV